MIDGLSKPCRLGRDPAIGMLGLDPTYSPLLLRESGVISHLILVYRNFGKELRLWQRLLRFARNDKQHLQPVIASEAKQSRKP